MTEIAVDVAPAAEPHRQRKRAADRSDAVFDLPAAMPLVLDLDGTLIAGDLLYKSFFSILRKNRLIVFSGCATWLRRGRAALKRQLALRNRIDWDRIKLHQDVVALAIREKTAGAELCWRPPPMPCWRASWRRVSRSSIRCTRRMENGIPQGVGEGRTADTNVSRRLHLCRRQQVGPRGVGAGQRHCTGQRTRGGQ